MPPDPHTDAPDHGATASAWLLGDLDERAAAAFERRLAADPALAEELHAVHEAVTHLRAVDAVTPPAGYTDRLRTRLATERAATAEVIPLAPRRRISPAALSAAAVGLVAVLGLAGIAGWLARGGGDVETALQAESADSGADAAAEPAEPLADEDQEALSGEEESAASGDATAGADRAGGGGHEQLEIPALPEPTVVEGPPLTAGQDLDAALRTRFGGGAETQALLGLPVSAARRVAAEYRAALEAAPPGPGAAPAACLDVVLDGPGPVLPARVEAFSLDGSPALAYVLVRAEPGADALTIVQIRVVAADTCAGLADVTL